MGYEHMTSDMPKELCMHKKDTCYKSKCGLPEWYDFFSPCILCNEEGYEDKHGYSTSTLKCRKFNRDTPLDVRIVATNNSTLPLSKRTAKVYYVEKEYLGFSAMWTEVPTVDGGSLADFGTVSPGDMAFAGKRFRLRLPAHGSYYVIAQINDIDNRLNPKPDSTTQVSFDMLDKNYLWSIIDTDKPYVVD